MDVPEGANRVGLATDHLLTKGWRKQREREKGISVEGRRRKRESERESERERENGAKEFRCTNGMAMNEKE